MFAPSGIFTPERLDAGIAVVEGWGYEVVRGPALEGRHRYLAGTDEERLEGLNWALTSSELDACWMARGGYGLSRLLDRVEWENVANRPVLGFSDGTALHSALYNACGQSSIHSPVLHSLADHVDSGSREYLRSLMDGSNAGPLYGRLLLKGRERLPVVGPLVGGNLCMLASLCGTRWQLNASGCILLLEDVAEPPYRVDRLRQQLKMSGVFEGVVGVAVGSLLGCEPPEGSDWRQEDLIREHLEDLGVPVLVGLPVGHGATNLAFVHGGLVRLEEEGLVPIRG
ncbi:MAG: LD-carboxypeptidase [Myxococcota bacterium]|nr:LD-carboxypeptidase [Myxococcota bacterium]